jgi:hypothetical protein
VAREAATRKNGEFQRSESEADDALELHPQPMGDRPGMQSGYGVGIAAVTWLEYELSLPSLATAVVT